MNEQNITVTVPKRTFDTMEETIREQNNTIELFKAKTLTLIHTPARMASFYHFVNERNEFVSLKELGELLNNNLIDTVEQLTQENEQLKRKHAALDEIKQLEEETAVSINNNSKAISENTTEIGKNRESIKRTE